MGNIHIGWPRARSSERPLGPSQGPRVPVKVVVAAIGSRGDVVPLAHLASRFAAAGHDVAMVTHTEFSRLLDPALTLSPVPSSPKDLMAGPAAAAVRSGSVRALNRARHVFADFIHAARDPTREALRDADVLVASTFAIAAVDEALNRGVPVTRAHMWPEYHELTGPMPLMPYGWLAPAPLRSVLRRGLRWSEPYLGGLAGWWQRGRLHLVAHPPTGLTTATLGSLYAFSPRLVPESPATGAVTGRWTGPRDAEASLSHDAEAAISSGDDWIFAGFGSMHQRDPRHLLSALGEACARIGVRAVAQLGGLRGALHPRVICVGEEPHEALFARVRVAVHHGGAGTTGAAVRAGVPSVVVPHFADQFYWGHRLRALGVAPRLLPRPMASAHTLTRRIARALDPVLTRRARRLADQVRGEDGTGTAVALVERWLAEGPRS